MSIMAYYAVQLVKIVIHSMKNMTGDIGIDSGDTGFLSF